MGKLTVIVDDELERKFRIAIAEKGGKRGDLTIAIEEAIQLWIEKQKKKASADVMSQTTSPHMR